MIRLEHRLKHIIFLFKLAHDIGIVFFKNMFGVASLTIYLNVHYISVLPNPLKILVKFKNLLDVTATNMTASGKMYWLFCLKLCRK